MKILDDFMAPSLIRDLPLGIRYNNPGNLEHDPHLQWDGCIGVGKGNKMIFVHAYYGVRAMGITIRHYVEVEGLTSYLDIITRYAPPETNDTVAYIKDVCGVLGVAHDDQIALKFSLLPLVNAMCTHENGITAVIYRVLEAGVRAALQHNFDTEEQTHAKTTS